MTPEKLWNLLCAVLWRVQNEPDSVSSPVPVMYAPWDRMDLCRVAVKLDGNGMPVEVRLLRGVDEVADNDWVVYGYDGGVRVDEPQPWRSIRDTIGSGGYEYISAAPPLRMVDVDSLPQPYIVRNAEIISVPKTKIVSGNITLTPPVGYIADQAVGGIRFINGGKNAAN